MNLFLLVLIEGTTELAKKYLNSISIKQLSCIEKLMWKEKEVIVIVIVELHLKAQEKGQAMIYININ